MSPPLDPPPPLPAPFYDAVGRVAVSSAILDLELAGLLDQILDSRVSGHITRGQSTDQLIRQLEVLVPRVIVHGRSEIDELVGRMTALKDARNHVIHAHWTSPVTDIEADVDAPPPELPDIPMVAFKPRRMKEDLSRDFTIDQLIDLARDLEYAANRAWALALNIRRVRRGHRPLDVERFLADTGHRSWLDETGEVIDFWDQER